MMEKEFGIDVWLDGNVLNVEMQTDIYVKFVEVAERNNKSPEEMLREFLECSLSNPDEIKRWYGESQNRRVLKE